MTAYTSTSIQDAKSYANAYVAAILANTTPSKVVRWDNKVFKTSHEAVQYMKHHKPDYSKDELMQIALELKKENGLCYKDRCFDNIKDLVVFASKHHDIHGKLESRRERDHSRLEKTHDTQSDKFWGFYDNIHKHYNMLYQKVQMELINSIHLHHRNIPIER